MNERIRELKEQATRKAMWPGDPDAGELDTERFTELIVQRCIECLWEEQRDPDSGITWFDGDRVQNRIKKFFGVK